MQVEDLFFGEETEEQERVPVVDQDDTFEDTLAKGDSDNDCRAAASLLDGIDMGKFSWVSS